MNEYVCIYCGVTYRRTDEMCACAVCGHPIEGRWFRSVTGKSDDDSRSRKEQHGELTANSPTRAA